jgi:hypothetical protein
MLRTSMTWVWGVHRCILLLQSTQLAADLLILNGNVNGELLAGVKIGVIVIR